MRRFAAQLNAMQTARPTVEELVDSDEWAELGEIVAVIDAQVARVRTALTGSRTPALAAAVQSALLACVAIRDLPPQRPTSLRRVSVPNSNRCLEPDCAVAGCLGNRVDGTTLILVHTKTARSRGTLRLELPAASAAAELLSHHLAWGRALLVAEEDCTALFLSRNGGTWSEAGFNNHLSRCLRAWGLPARITHTKARKRRGSLPSSQASLTETRRCRAPRCAAAPHCGHGGE